MRILHTKQNITIEIAGDDWDRNLAQEMIKHIKALGKGNYYYNPVSKVWNVRNTPEYKEYFRKVKQDLKSSDNYQPMPVRVDLDDFDVEKWLEDTFGPSANIGADSSSVEIQSRLFL